MPAPHSTPEPRVVAIDLHKTYALIEAVDTQLRVVLPPCRVSTLKLDGWVRAHLRQTDTVVLEATTSVWHVCDLLQPLVARVVVANTRKLKALTQDAVRTDQRAIQILARLQSAGLIPEVWIPPQPVRELRTLVHHRQRLVSQRTAAKNRLHSWLWRHHLAPPEGHPLAAGNRRWWDGLALAASEKLCAQQDWTLVDQLNTLIDQVDAELARLSGQEEWRSSLACLLQLPGFGLRTALTLLSAIGDIQRFPSARQLVGYAGLGTRVHVSGQTHQHGGITKTGRREMRTALVEAAWVAVRTDPHWQERFAPLEQRCGRPKAIVAIARQLLVSAWYCLSAHQAARYVDPAALARRLMGWATRYRLATTLGISRGAFVRQELDRLGIGQELTSVRYGGRSCPLPPSSLVMTLPAAEVVRPVALEQEA